ncbi:short chain dehydrogenase [Phlyctema vagabunda]|uniref:Short chain dehydrogenase n=1 Tax=Phlyctema vagabunda TaxID=108571 RepID=A0ABR4PVA7_9HELO
MPENKSSLIILVTGANRGIGFNIIQSTARRLPDATFILGCRSSKRGHEAVASLQKLGITAPLGVLELDVTDDNSICLAASLLRKRFGRLDVLINAASLTLPSTPSSTASFLTSTFSPHKKTPSVHTSTKDLSHLRTTYTQTLSTNLTSVACVSQAFLPLLASSVLPLPKLINISSPFSDTHAHPGSGKGGEVGDGSDSETEIETQDAHRPSLSYNISTVGLEYFSREFRELKWAECEVYVVRPPPSSSSSSHTLPSHPQSSTRPLDRHLAHLEGITRLIDARDGRFRSALGWELGPAAGGIREVVGM